MIRSSVRLPAGAVFAAALLTLPQTEPLRPGESRVHEIELEAGRAWRVAVEQLGIDVTVEVTGPDGRRIAAVDAPFDRQGTETVLVTRGSRVVVRAREAGAPPGQYFIRVEALEDPGRIEAEAALSRAGEAYLEGSAEGRRRSLAEYLRASELCEGEQKARALYAAAVLSRLTGDTRQALEIGERVLPLWQSLGDRLWEAATRNEIGLDLWLLGRIDEARASYAVALAIQREIGDRYGEAVSLSNLCASDLPRGKLREALACYDEALLRLREVKAAALEGAALTSSGRALDILGQPDQALLRYREALELTRSVGDRAGEAQALNNMSVLHREMGEFQEALASYSQALEIFSSLQNRRWQARVLHNLGAIYQGLGEPRQAISQYEQALPLWREAGDREGEAVTLTNLGRVHGLLGDPRRALELQEQALALARAAGDRRTEGITLSRMGSARAALGDPAAALVGFDSAIERLRAVGDLVSEIEALRGRGEAQAALGEPGKALESLGQALAIARGARIPVSEAQALCALARVERALGRSGEARAHAAAAVEVVEALRPRIGNPDLRSSFAATLHEAYELEIDLLLEAHRASPGAGFVRTALETGERARARTLLELLGEAGVDLDQGVPAALLERRTTLERRSSARAERALREKDPAARTALAQEHTVLLRELDLADAEIRESSPAQTALIRPQPSTATEVQALLDPGTLLLSYSLGETRSHLFAVTSGSLESFELPARSVVEEAARRIHGGMSVYDAAGRAGKSEEAADLSGMILGPVADRLNGQRLAVRVVIVADGALHYVPFGALPVPSSEDAAPVPSLERHECLYLPSASALAAQRQRLASRPPAGGWVAVVADPVFDLRDPTFERLPASRQEAEAIAALAPPGQARLALGLQASRPESALGDRLSGYRAVHFATHGVVDAEHPSLSGLALSDGFLNLRDVYGLRLGADLVVLSGCRTALGREVRGEGLAGLARGFFHAGAPRVVASLWRVEDRATSELMIRFYRGMWSEGRTPAAALREAQLSIRTERRWRDPYFWAGFVLQGDWR